MPSLKILISLQLCKYQKCISLEQYLMHISVHTVLLCTKTLCEAGKDKRPHFYTSPSETVQQSFKTLISNKISAYFPAMTAVQLPNHSTQMCCPVLSSTTLRLISCFSPIAALADIRWNISGCCVNLCLLMLWSTWIKESPFTHFPPGSDFNLSLGTGSSRQTYLVLDVSAWQQTHEGQSWSPKVQSSCSLSWEELLCGAGGDDLFSSVFSFTAPAEKTSKAENQL